MEGTWKNKSFQCCQCVLKREGWISAGRGGGGGGGASLPPSSLTDYSTHLHREGDTKGEGGGEKRREEICHDDKNT